MDIANCFRFLSDNPESKIHHPKWVGVLALAITLTCGGAWAQQPKKVPRLGYLSGTDPASDSTRAETIRRGLRDLGYIGGTEHRHRVPICGGETRSGPRACGRAGASQVDIIVAAGGGSTIRAAKNATKTIPIVMGGSGVDLSRQA